MQNKTSLQKSLEISLDHLFKSIDESSKELSKVINIFESEIPHNLKEQKADYGNLKAQVRQLQSKIDTKDINEVMKNYNDIYFQLKTLNDSIIEEIEQLKIMNPEIKNTYFNKDALKFKAAHLALNLRNLLQIVQASQTSNREYTPRFDGQSSPVNLTPINLPAPPQVIAINVPKLPTPTHTSAPKVLDKDNPSQNEWARIRLEKIGSKWENVVWQNKKINTDKKDAPVDLDKAAIQACAEKINSLIVSPKAPVNENRQAKIHIYVEGNWKSEKNAEGNILTLIQDDKPIFEVRPGENKIQFLISDPTAEQRVAAFEMFQQMCRAKGMQPKVKINCDDKDMKKNFQDDANLAGIRPVESFSPRPSPNK